MISLDTRGDWSNTLNFFDKMLRQDYISAVEAQAQRGVEALMSATPVRSGLTASSWGYKIERGFGKTTISWTNSNINEGVNIAVILQYGHGTGTGGYINGVDYINPTIRPVFDDIVKQIEKAVKA